MAITALSLSLASLINVVSYISSLPRIKIALCEHQVAKEEKLKNQLAVVENRSYIVEQQHLTDMHKAQNSGGWLSRWAKHLGQ